MIAVYLVAISALCFLLFAWDKFCAIHGYWRIPERTLLMLAAIGGTPGAFIGQTVLRHKTRKQPFVAYLLLIAALQILGLITLSVMTGGAALALLLL